MDFVQLICTPFSYIVSAVNAWTGSYLLALLAFTVVMKVVLFPLSIKQQKNSVRQAKLRPREEVIRAKYAGRTDKPTQQKMQQEIMEMYQEEKFSPLSGCLPLLIQLPLLIILYNIVRQPLMYTVRYNTEEIDALNAAMAVTDYYDARAQLEGAVGGEFKLERTAKGEYLFYDPMTGEDVRMVEETVSNQKCLVFYEKGEDGEFEKDPVRFLKKTPYEQAEDSVANADTVNGIPAYPLRDGTVQLDQSGMVAELKERADYYTELYTTIVGEKAGSYSSAEELDLAGRLPDFELFDGAINLGETPDLSEMNWLLIIPVLTFITSYGSQWLTRKFTYQPQTQESQSSMRMMNVMMPLMSVWITFMVPAALAVYWIMQNLISPLQQIILAKCWPVPKYTEEELKKAKSEIVAKQKGKTDKKSIPAPKRRSLVYDDDEEEEMAEESAPKKKKENANASSASDSPIGKADLK